MWPWKRKPLTEAEERERHNAAVMRAGRGVILLPTDAEVPIDFPPIGGLPPAPQRHNEG